MLEREEIENISRTKGLAIKNAEKDYLLEMLLFILYNENGRILVFKGGTALYKIHSLNRFSEDLDFTLNSSKIDIDKLFRKIIRRLADIGINGRIKEISEYKNQKNAKLELRGPLFDGNISSISLVSINISLKEKPIYEPEQRTIFSQYRDITSFDIFVMPLKELLAEKIRALMTRDKARDAYDVWFLLKKGVKFDMKDINKKLKLHKEFFNNRKLIEKIEEKRKSWEIDLGGLIIGELPEFNKIRKEMIDLLPQKDRV